MANLVELYDLVIQAQALNGVPLSHGHVYIYALGRTKLMDTWSDIDGESLNSNPVILDNAGQAHIYVSDDFDYTLVFTDEFNNEIFSVDKYLLSKGEHSHADVAVAPSEHIGVSSYHVGEVTVYVPYLTGEVGKVYEGIDPIVVNNDVNRISANHIPLGVQDPLYFVEDSETACIIGCSAQTEIPSALSSKWDEASDAVIANSAQWAEGTEYEAGSYIDIDGHTISVTGLQPEGDYAYNSALSSKLDTSSFSSISGDFLTAIPDEYATKEYVISSVSSKLDVSSFSSISGDWLTKESADTLYQPTGNYQTAGDYYSASNPSAFVTSGELSVISGEITGMIPTGEYLTKESADTLYQPIGDYLTTADSGNFYTTANESGFITGVPAGTMNESAFEYDSNNKISGYNGSAFAGEGTAGVSGTNVVFVPRYEGGDWGEYYSATISGDVRVTTGNYANNGASIGPGHEFSLSSIGNKIDNKLDKNKIEDSNTIKIINNHAEATDKAYRRIVFTDMLSAYSVYVDYHDIRIYFYAPGSYLHSAIVTVETTATGRNIPDGWSLVSYENNSAIFTKYYTLNESVDTFYLGDWGGWGNFTNAEGSATFYSAVELATLAFKDEISGITYTTGSI